MYLSDEQARARLNSKRNLCFAPFLGFNKNTLMSAPTEPTEPNVILTRAKRAGNNRKNLPNFVKTEIAILARSGEKQTTLAAQFGTSQTEISMIERGKIKSVDEVKVKEIVEERLNQARDLALDKLMQSLGLIDGEKLKSSSAKDLSIVALNMGKITERAYGNSEQSRVNLNIFVPETRDEKHFAKVEV